MVDYQISMVNPWNWPWKVHGIPMDFLWHWPWSSMETGPLIFHGKPMEYFCKGYAGPGDWTRVAAVQGEAVNHYTSSVVMTLIELRTQKERLCHQHLSCCFVSGVLPDCVDPDDYSYDSYGAGDGGGGSFLDSPYQVIKWQHFQQKTWAGLLDENCKPMWVLVSGFRFQVAGLKPSILSSEMLIGCVREWRKERKMIVSEERRT